MYKAIQCHLPINFIVEDITGYNKRWHEKYIWFVNTIIFKSLTEKTESYMYVNLQSKVIRKFLGPRYTNNIIAQLLNGGVIERNPKYKPSQFSMSYRLTKKYRDTEIVSSKITKQTYCRKIEHFNRDHIKQLTKDNPLIQHEFFNLTCSRIQYDKALEVLAILHPNKAGHPYKSRLVTLNQYEAMHKATFNDGGWTQLGFTFKVVKGRFYSPATMLSRDLEHLTYFTGYEGETVVDCDMPNSQLCFFDMYANRNVTTYEEGVYDDSNSSKDRTNALTKFRAHTSFNTSLLTLPSYVVTIRTWTDIIFEGKGYERMMYLTKWKGKETGHTKDERQDFKPKFFGGLFYNKYSDKYKTKMEDAFMIHHRKEATALLTVKKKLGNSLLAIEVQRLEAKLFHTIIVGHMRTNHRDIPFNIKHDSIHLPIEPASYIIPELNELVRAFFKRNDIELKTNEL